VKTLTGRPIFKFNAKESLGIDIPELGNNVCMPDIREAFPQNNITVFGRITGRMADRLADEYERLTGLAASIRAYKECAKYLSRFKSDEEWKSKTIDAVEAIRADYDLPVEAGTTLSDIQDYVDMAISSDVERFEYGSPLTFVSVDVHPNIVFGDLNQNQGIGNNEWIEYILEVKKDGVESFIPNGFRIPVRDEWKRGTTILFIDRFNSPIAIYDKETDALSFTYFVTGDNQQARVELRDFLLRIASVTGPRDSAVTVASSNATIGADIEFSVYDTDMIFHSATEYVPDSQDGQIGTDGNVETLEIRPDYSTKPLEVVENIETLLRKLATVLPDGHDLLGGGGLQLRRSTGIHIHFANTSMDASRGDTRLGVENFCAWLDLLLSYPVLTYCQGVKRADEQYGQYGDYRNSRTHHGFPHVGFEYRTLPTVCINRQITEAVFVIAKMCLDTYESGKTIKFDEKSFSVDWYKDLVGYAENSKLVNYFVNFCMTNTNLEVPILSNWLYKKFEKDRECDVDIIFCSEDYQIKDFVMYNPQKLFDAVIVWSSSNPEQAIVLSASVKTLESYLIRNVGFVTVVKDTVPARVQEIIKKGKHKRILSIGLPKNLVAKLASKSQGSRNRIKMFIQELIKHI
jgi:hypothetical protein